MKISSVWSPADNYGNISPGQYTLQIRLNGDNSCIGSLPLDASPSSTDLGLVVSTSTSATCGLPDGSVTLQTSVSGDLEYSLDGNSWQGSSTFNDLPGGQQLTFYVRSTNNTDCEESITYTLGEDPLPTPGFGVFPPSTCDASDGIITVDPPVSNGSYNYEIEGGPSTTNGTFDNIGIGLYNINIIDQNNSNCNTLITNVSVASNGINADITSNDETVCGEGDGTITVDVLEGGPFEYQILGEPGGFQPVGNTF